MVGTAFKKNIINHSNFLTPAQSSVMPMSRRPDAKTVKITENSLQHLKLVKEEKLNETSYSQSILKIHKAIEDKIPDLPSPEPDLDQELEKKDKTIVLSREAHVLLNQIKYEKNLRTISDAIEWICKAWLELEGN